MIPLDHPIWAEAKDAFNDKEPVNKVLLRLERDWDEVYDNLLHDRLCHQETLYSATFLAVPHLLELAWRLKGKRQLDLATDLAFISFVALREEGWSDAAPSGNNGLQLCAGSGLSDLRRAKGDWPRVAEDFISSLPEIARLGRKVWPAPYNEDGNIYLAGGILAAEGQQDIASHILSNEGVTVCQTCLGEILWANESGRIYAYDWQAVPTDILGSITQPEPPVEITPGQLPEPMIALLESRDDAIVRGLGESYLQTFVCPGCATESQFDLGWRHRN